VYPFSHNSLFRQSISYTRFLFSLMTNSYMFFGTLLRIKDTKEKKKKNDSYSTHSKKEKKKAHTNEKKTKQEKENSFIIYMYIHIQYLQATTYFLRSNTILTLNITTPLKTTITFITYSHYLRLITSITTK